MLSDVSKRNLVWHAIPSTNSGAFIDIDFEQYVYFLFICYYLLRARPAVELLRNCSTAPTDPELLIPTFSCLAVTGTYSSGFAPHFKFKSMTGFADCAFGCPCATGDRCEIPPESPTGHCVQDFLNPR